jgi:hypothetical protein
MDNDPYLVSTHSKGRYPQTHITLIEKTDDFTLGFLTAMDFLQYVKSRFSISVACELWPPQSEYDKKKSVKDGILVWNFFWEKYERARCGSREFYESLDYENRRILYNWYRREVDRKP